MKYKRRKVLKLNISFHLIWNNEIKIVWQTVQKRFVFVILQACLTYKKKTEEKY